MKAAQGNQSQESASSNALVPFIIGVTGHRDPYQLQTENSSIDEIKEAIKDCILYWRKKLGKQTPIWLMSAMAEGCDLLAVQALEELRDSGISDTDNFEVFPCLPMDSAEYEKDFVTTPEEYQFGLSGFKKHLSAHHKNTIVVSEQFQTMQTKPSSVESNAQQQRDYQYLNVGLFIAKYSHVLIALWDGNVSGGVGGTADIVRYKCGERLEWCNDKIAIGLQPHSEFDGQIGGVVQHISINRRQSNPATPLLSELIQLEHKDYKDTPYPLYVSYCLNKQENPIKEFLSNEFALLNKQLIRFNTFAEQNHVDASRHKIAGIEKGLNKFSRLFYQADASAMVYQKSYRNNLGSFIRIAVYGLISYELMSALINKPLGIVFNVTILVCILGLVFLIKQEKKNQTKIKYQTFRCVSEALRIRAYLNLANVPPDVKPIIPRRYRQNWPIIHYVSRLAELELWTQTVSADIGLVKTEWLQGQIDFLDSRLQMSGKTTFEEFIYKRPKKAATFLARWASRAFILAIVVATILIDIQIAHEIQQGQSDSWFTISTLMLLGAQFALMLGAVMALWQELANYHYTYNGYENLRMLYVRALYLLDKKQDSLQAAMLAELAQEAMAEHAVWNHSEHQTDLIHR